MKFLRGFRFEKFDRFSISSLTPSPSSTRYGTRNVARVSPLQSHTLAFRRPGNPDTCCGYSGYNHSCSLHPRICPADSVSAPSKRTVKIIKIYYITSVRFFFFSYIFCSGCARVLHLDGVNSIDLSTTDGNACT